MVLGLLERPEKKLVRKYLSAVSPVIELGSSYGNVTLEIVKKIGKNIPVVSIEANPALAKWLERQMQKSSRTNHKVLNYAVSYDSNPVNFVIDTGNLGFHVDEVRRANSIEVNGITIPEIVKISGFETDSIVCDIEGSEFAAFDKNSEILINCHSIIIELHPAHSSEAEILISQFVHSGLIFREKIGEVLAFTR